MFTTVLGARTHREGFVKMLPFTALTVYLALLGTYLVARSVKGYTTAIPANTPPWDGDTEDMVVDYIETYPGIASLHGLFPPTAGGLSVVVAGRNLSTTAVADFTVDVTLGFTARILRGSVSVVFPVSFDNGAATVDYSALGDSGAFPMYLSTTSFEDGTWTVARLSEINFTVYKNVAGTWSVFAVNASYSVVWEGPISTTEPSFPAPGTVVLSVALTDLSMPTPYLRPGFTTFLGSSMTWGGIFVLLVAAVAVIAHLPLCFTVHRNVRINRGLPPPKIELVLFTPRGPPRKKIPTK